MFYLPHPPLDWHSPGLNERMLVLLLGLSDGGLGLFNFFFFDSPHIEVKKNPKKLSMVHSNHGILHSPSGRLDLIFPFETYIYKL
jgi:hypothetical protein